ncbi:hypothetical protein C8Q75DRAFT_802773 [Abortiporus biennis]|nr:hypothetical protein C8Q75DRAFT_802773 [Abortiporus biennis]
MDTWPQRSNMIDNAKFGANVFKVLKAWSEAGESGPDKLIYLLCPEYDTFEQTDDHRKEQSLIKVADLLGFQLGHATFVRQFSVERCRASCCRCANTPDDPYGRDDPEGGKGCKDTIRMCGRYCYHDTTEQTESDDYRLLNEEFFIENLIGINSEAITSGYKYVDYKKSEWIPSNMDEVLRKGDYYHQEYDSFECSDDKKRALTVLVIWPKVKNSKTSRRTAADDKLVEFILDGHRRKPAMNACMITKAVCRVASARHDCILWNRAVSLGSPSGGLAVLPTRDVVEAFLNLPFSYIRPSFDMLLQDTQTNTLRFKLLDELRKHVIGCYDLEQWFTTNSRMCLRSMRVPEKTEVWLHALLAARHGVQFYRDIILPQVINDVDAEFLSSLAVSIFENKQIPPNKDELISHLLQIALSRVNLRHDLHRKPNSSNMRLDPDFETAKKYIDICLSLRRLDHICYLFPKVADASGMSEKEHQHRENKFLMLPELARNVAGSFIAMALLDRESRGSVQLSDVRGFIEAVVVAGGWQHFESNVLPKSQPTGPSTECPFLSWAEHLHSYKNQLREDQHSTLQEMVDSFARMGVNNASSTLSDDICKILTTCLDIESVSSIQFYLDCVNGQCNLNQHDIESTFVDLITYLRQFGLKSNTLHNFASTFQAIIKFWIDKCLGPEPTGDELYMMKKFLPKWQCPWKCVECQYVKDLLASPPTGKQFAITLECCDPHVLNHVQLQLWGSLSGLIADWSTVTNDGDLVGLKVELKPFRYATLLWEEKRKKGCQFLNLMSPNEDELQRLLGPHYTPVVELLRGLTEISDP